MLLGCMLSVRGSEVIFDGESRIFGNDGVQCLQWRLCGEESFALEKKILVDTNETLVVP